MESSTTRCTSSSQMDELFVSKNVGTDLGVDGSVKNETMMGLWAGTRKDKSTSRINYKAEGDGFQSDALYYDANKRDFATNFIRETIQHPARTSTSRARIVTATATHEQAMALFVDTLEEEHHHQIAMDNKSLQLSCILVVLLCRILQPQEKKVLCHHHGV